MAPSPYDLSCCWDVKHKHNNDNMKKLIIDISDFVVHLQGSYRQVYVKFKDFIDSHSVFKDYNFMKYSKK